MIETQTYLLIVSGIIFLVEHSKPIFLCDLGWHAFFKEGPIIFNDPKEDSVFVTLEDEIFHCSVDEKLFFVIFFEISAIRFTATLNGSFVEPL